MTALFGFLESATLSLENANSQKSLEHTHIIITMIDLIVIIIVNEL